MKLSNKVLAGIAVAFAFVLTTPSSRAVTLHRSYSSSEIKQMMREAHTPDQYRAIAQYYDERHTEFSAKAADEMAEWARRSEMTSGLAAKYPRPVDAARNLYEYYAHEADEAAFQAYKYHRFEAGTGGTLR